MHTNIFLAQVEAEKAAIREQLQKSEEQLEQARRSVQLADPDVAVFKSLFAGVQEEFNRLHGALLKVRQSNPEAGAKLTAAVKALLEKLGKDVS